MTTGRINQVANLKQTTTSNSDGDTDVSVISDLDSENKYYDNQYYNSDTECKNDNNQYNYDAEYDDHNCCRFQINIMDAHIYHKALINGTNQELHVPKSQKIRHGNTGLRCLFGEL